MSQTSSPRVEAVAQSLQLTELFEPLEDVQFWIKDREGRYCRINRAFLLNYALSEPGQVIGKTDYDLSPAFLADQFCFDDEQVLSGQRVVNRIERVGQAGQTSSWNVTNKIPIRDARDRIIGTAGTTRQLGAEGRELVGAHVGRFFERKFCDNFRVTPQEYIRILRVRIACRVLDFTEKPLAEVALECGFADQSHFAREFRHQSRQTSREYREHYRRL